MEGTMQMLNPPDCPVLGDIPKIDVRAVVTIGEVVCHGVLKNAS